MTIYSFQDSDVFDLVRSVRMCRVFCLWREHTVRVHDYDGFKYRMWCSSAKRENNTL